MKSGPLEAADCKKEGNYRFAFILKEVETLIGKTIEVYGVNADDNSNPNFTINGAPAPYGKLLEGTLPDVVPPPDPRFPFPAFIYAYADWEAPSGTYTVSSFVDVAFLFPVLASPLLFVFVFFLCLHLLLLLSIC